MKTKKQGISPRKEPHQERGKETVEVIVGATAHILEKDGFEKISTNKIAERAGVSIGSLYQYFPTKDAIFSYMMDRYVRQQTEMIDKILANQKNRDLKSAIREVILAIMKTKRAQSRFNMMFAYKIFSYAKFEALSWQDDFLLELFTRHLEPYQDEVRTENIELSLYLIIQTIKVLPVALMFQKKFSLTDPRIDDELVELIYRYIKK